MACASPTLSGSSGRSYLTRGKFGEDQNDDGFIDTRWVELEELYDNCGKQNLNRALKAYRTAEKYVADEASTLKPLSVVGEMVIFE